MSKSTKKWPNRYVVGFSGYRQPHRVWGADEVAFGIDTMSNIREARAMAKKRIQGEGATVFKLVPVE